MLVRRDTREKRQVPFSQVAAAAGEMLEQMQQDMYNRAKEHLESSIYTAANYEELKELVATKQGFVKSMWCGDEACELKIKEETGATSRCMPFHQEHLGDTCVCCGRPAKKMIYWGKAY